MIGYLGHFSYIKGVHLLVEAFSQQLCENFPELSLSIAWSGKGDNNGTVRSLLKKLPQNRINITGIVDPLEFLKSIDLLCLPYITNSVPLPPAVLHECVQAKTPVIISDLDGLSAGYSSYCRFFRTGDLEDLKSKLNKILERIKA